MPIPALLCPSPRHLSPPEQGSASLPGSLQTELLQACLSRPGLGSVWACSGGWSRQVGSIQTPGQWQQDSALLNPNQAHKLEEQIEEVGRASTACLGLHLALLSCWTPSNFPGAEQPQDSIHLSPCHFSLSKFHSTSPSFSVGRSFSLSFSGGSSHQHSMLHHPSLL